MTWKEGSQAVLATLGADGAFVDDDYAKDHDLHVGSPIAVQVPSGKKLQLKVKGIFDPPAGGSPFGHVTFSSATFDRELRVAEEPLHVRPDARRRRPTRTRRRSRTR